MSAGETAGNPPPLQIHHLVKDYGSFRAVNKVSFTLKKGEIFGLLGPNGAGKTSIISCIVTLQRPTEGWVKVFGNDSAVAPTEAKMKLGFVPQELINHGYFDVEEIMQFHSGYFRQWDNKDHIDYLLNKVGLYEHRKKRVKALSGGMKRRLLIAKALVHRPGLLLLDEPTAGVDIELRNSLWDFVRELQKEGVTVLLTTHYLEEAENLCDRVGILQNGHLRTVGETQDLIAELTQRVVVVRFSKVFDMSTNPYFLKNSDKETHFSLPHGTGVGDLLASLGPSVSSVDDLVIQEGRLEEAFVRVLGGQL